MGGESSLQTMGSLSDQQPITRTIKKIPFFPLLASSAFPSWLRWRWEGMLLGKVMVSHGLSSNLKISLFLFSNNSALVFTLVLSNHYNLTGSKRTIREQQKQLFSSSRNNFMPMRLTNQIKVLKRHSYQQCLILNENFWILL